MFFSATFLGFVVDWIRTKMDALRKGKSMVVESDHTLILGLWTVCAASGFLLTVR